MSHGPLPWEPRPPLYVVTHGLTMTAYVDGLPVAVKRLAPHEAANLAIDLLTGLRMSLGTLQPALNSAGATIAQIDSACLSFRHDFGLMDHQERNAIRHQASMWQQAWAKVQSAAPTENLPFRAHEANRRADGVNIHADHEEQP